MSANIPQDNLNFEILMLRSEEKERQKEAKKRAMPAYHFREEVSKTIETIDDESTVFDNLYKDPTSTKEKVENINRRIVESSATFAEKAPEYADKGMLHVGKTDVARLYHVSEPQCEQAKNATFTALGLMGVKMKQERLGYEYNEERKRCEIYVEGLRELRDDEKVDCMIM